MKPKTFKVRTATVNSKGQFTIPKDICTRLGVQRGDTFVLWAEKGSIVAQRVKRNGKLETPTL